MPEKDNMLRARVRSFFKLFSESSDTLNRSVTKFQRSIKYVHGIEFIGKTKREIRDLRSRFANITMFCQR